MTRRFLLSIDGGGIRGIIPLCALVKLEQTIGQSAGEIFSFIAGTSTGAVITTGLAAGMSARAILDLYVRRGPDVFPQRPWNVLKRILFGRMYSIDRLHDLIAEAAGPAAKWTLNQAKVDLLITAKRVPDGKQWYFVKDKPANSSRTGHLNIVDCATASAAGPTYFQPFEFPEDRSVLRRQQWEPVGPCVDGGVGVAGNPAYQAAVEAFYFTGDYTPEETTIVSLGTGRYVPSLTTSPIPKTIWGWLGWVLDQLLSSPGEQQTELVQRHFEQTPFYRLDVALEHKIPMDGVKQIDRLVEIGQRFAELIDWEDILSNTDTTFRITPRNTQWSQYSRPIR